VQNRFGIHQTDFIFKLLPKIMKTLSMQLLICLKFKHDFKDHPEIFMRRVFLFHPIILSKKYLITSRGHNSDKSSPSHTGKAA
jgi:membrane-bound acyltransferase YfiQ involved in biofilm formation